MNRRRTVLNLGISVLVAVVPVYSQFWSVDKEKIIFSAEAVTKGVTWSNNLTLTSEALETKALPKNHTQDIWVQTHAFPVALSFRPPRRVSFMLHFDGSINQVDGIAMPPEIFIRYSCDKTNWSTWYLFNKTDKKSDRGSNIYETQITIPNGEVQRYQSFMMEWRGTNPIWDSDENEFCEWLVKKEPDFFARVMPFIGYVQVRVEKVQANSSQSLRTLTVGYSSSVSGMASFPRDKSTMSAKTEEKWHFEGPTK